MKKLLSCAVLVLLLAGAVFAGPGAEAGGTQAAATSTPVGQYPISSNATLRYWLVLNANVSPNYTNLGDTPFGKQLVRLTGVNVQFEHPAAASAAAAQEALNLMLASGDDMPDVMEFNWVTMPGGPEKLIADGAILRLNDAIARFAPNLTRFLRDNPAYDRMVKTDNGSYYVFPFIRDGEVLLYSQGLMIRKDWLDELGLAVPQTVQDWHNVLVAFKTRKNIATPFTIAWSNRQRMFMPSFNILNGMYISHVDGRIHFGQMEPGYRQWITTMAAWYKEGLIDPDLITLTTAQQNQKMIAGTVGATVASVGSGIGTWTPAARASNPRYEIMALQYPVQNRGDTLIYSIPNQAYSGQDSPAISAYSSNVEIAARFLDFGYTQAGHNLFNFGIEGESYTMVNGKQTYTPATMAGGPNNWPVGQSLGAYMRAIGAGPFIQDTGYIEQYYALPEQAQALVNFVLPGATDYFIPAITPTQEESQEYGRLISEINTYVDETTARWLIGTEAITDATWNAYLARLNQLNIARAIAIQQGALGRFNSR